MAAVCNRAGHYIFVLWFLSSFFFFLLLFFPRLISVDRLDRLDVYHTYTHDVALARI